jgi:sugar phosphate isomerase/epimerase
VADTQVGVELIVFGARQNEDLDGVLAACAAAGYDGIEGGPLGMGGEEAQVKDLYAKHGLVCCGVHTGYAVVSDPAQLEPLIAYAKEMGAPYLIASGVAEGEGIARYEDSAGPFNQVGAACQAAGIEFCYHNHAWEFEVHDGVKGIHRLAELTDPDLVKLNADLYWVHIGGEQPAEFVACYATRIPYFHIKDGSPGEFIELGQGEVDLKAAVDAALAVEPTWLVAEQDRTAIEPNESVKISRDYLKTLGI